MAVTTVLQNRKQETDNVTKTIVTTFSEASLSSLPSVQGRSSIDIVLGATFGDLEMNSTDVETDAAVIEHDNTNTDRIIIKEDGLYGIGYTGNADVTAAASVDFELEIRARINDTTVINGSLARAGNHYSGSGAFSEDPHVSNYFVGEFTAGDYITPQGQYILGSGAPTAINLQNFQFNVTKLQGSQGDTGPTGAGANIIVQKDDATVGTVTATLNFEGAGVSSVVDEGSNKTTVTIDGVSHGQVYMNDNMTVTPLTQNVPAKVLGTTTSNLLTSDLSSSNNRITYTGSATKVFNIEADLCVEGASNDRRCNFNVSKNGIQYDPITTCADIQGTDKFVSVAWSGLIELSTNDYVEIWMTNIENNDDALVHDLSLTLLSV